LWIVARGTRCVDLGEPISERRLYQAMSTPGVLWAEPLLLQFSQWRLPDGRQEIAQIVGLVPQTHLNLPWGMAAGRRQDIRHDDGVIIDERERSRFGPSNRPLRIGDRAEILNVKARVAGFSRGVGSFTTIPYVFTTHKQAQRYTPIGDGQTKFIVVKATPAVGVAELQQRLAQRMPDVEVLTGSELSQRTRAYWVLGTGIGLGLVFAAGLGFLVGSVVVSQTIYSTTLERLAEYGTLKAIGMSNRGLGMIILKQAIWIGILGFGVGASLAVAFERKLPEWHLPVETPLWMFACVLLATLGMCASASITSVARVFRLPPAVVFRG
jgi:putative ABC transport system permease protein